MKYTNLYINGAWVDGADKVRFDVINPATEEVLTSVASAEISDADAALDAAEGMGRENTAPSFGSIAQGLGIDDRPTG